MTKRVYIMNGCPAMDMKLVYPGDPEDGAMSLLPQQKGCVVEANPKGFPTTAPSQRAVPAGGGESPPPLRGEYVPERLKISLGGNFFSLGARRVKSL